MRWIRSNICGFTRLALFALAIQVVVTFDHVHLDALSLTAAETSTGVEKASAAFSKADSQDQKSHRAADNDCPICALIQLASTSTPAVAPPLPFPTILAGTILEVPAAPDFIAPRVFAYQARGPPAT